MSSPFRIDPTVVGGILEAAGAAEGTRSRLNGLAWLMILEEAEGTPRLKIAETMNVDLIDLEELRFFTVYGTGFDEKWDDAETQAGIARCDSIWLQGIAAVRTSALMTQQAIGQGWDQVEAIAIDKVASYLSSMQATGNPLEMIEIASKANKAIRRNRGEGSGRGNGGFGMAGSNNDNSDVNATLSIPTEGGVMTLNLSSRVRNQIETAQNKVVEGKAEGRLGGIHALEMLTVEKTRALVTTPAESESLKAIDSEEAATFEDFLKGMGNE